MSILGSLITAVSGMRAYSQSMGNISDNIANSNSVGYKRVETDFSSLVTQSSKRLHTPGGVSGTPNYRVSAQGPIQQSDQVTSFAISGDGFFAVSGEATTTASTANTLRYTRAGNFRLDADGFLVNSAGYYLNGWATDSDGAVINSNELRPIQLSNAQGDPVETSNIDYIANLPANAADATVFDPSQIQYFDSLGNAHNLDVTWTKNSLGNWSAGLSFTSNSMDATSVSGTSIAPSPLTITFDSNGAIATINGSGVSGDPATVDVTVTYGAPYGTVMTPQTITLDFGTFGSSTGTTQFAGEDLEVSSTQQDGSGPGSFRSLSLDSEGILYTNFDNGRVKPIFKIPVSMFNNPNGLEVQDGSVYATTTDSGSVLYAAAGQSGAGKIISNALETANVDIADEFTKMIVTQRAYSANARVITTADQMLEEAVNLRR